VVKREAKRDFPQDVFEQLDLAIGAVFNSGIQTRDRTTAV